MAEVNGSTGEAVGSCCDEDDVDECDKVDSDPFMNVGVDVFEYVAGEML
jgi:hypothetical protein